MKTLLISLISIALAATCWATIYHSDGSASGVNAIANGVAQPGDTITMPGGGAGTATFTWNFPVTLPAGISLKGKGSGRIIGNSKTSTTISGGSKTFVTTRVIAGIATGQTLRIAKMPSSTGAGAREKYMEGTVTSYTGQTLVMNITTTGGSGTYQFWYVATKPKTAIISDATLYLSLSNSTGFHTDVSGIQFQARNADSIDVYGDAYIVPKAIIHDCWFQTGPSITLGILAQTNQALIYRCSFDDTWTQQALGISIKWEDDNGHQSARSNSTMGTSDTDGATNFYVEDCDFHGYLNAADWDSNSRVVMRRNLFDNAGMTSHGADTGGPWGLRHIELYNNEFIFDDLGDCDGSVTLGLTWFFWMRGGTGVITGNILPNIYSCAWNQKANISFSVINIDRNAGCYACWSSYPAPLQIGQGYGPGATFHTWDCSNYTDDADYYTYSEPVYVWNNTGTGGNATSLNEDPDTCSGNGNQQLSDYIQAGRDYIVGTPKPGYQKFTYPHPLRQ